MLGWEEFDECFLSSGRMTLGLWLETTHCPEAEGFLFFLVSSALLFSPLLSFRISLFLWMIWFTFSWKIQTSWFTCCCSFKLQMESKLKINNSEGKKKTVRNKSWHDQWSFQLHWEDVAQATFLFSLLICYERLWVMLNSLCCYVSPIHFHNFLVI